VRRIAGALALTLWLGQAPLLAGQPQAEIRWLWLGQWDSEMELRYESVDEETQSKTTSASSEATYESFSELFMFRNRGYVYHPLFLDFNAELGIEFDQSDGSRTNSNSGTEQESRDGDAPRYSITGMFLQEHTVSLAFALHKFNSTIARAFSRIAEVDNETQQATLYYKNEVFPMRATLFHSILERRELGRGEDRKEDLTTFEYTAEYDENDTTSVFTYEYTDSVEDVMPLGEGGYAVQILREIHRLTHNAVFRFGAARESFFRSLVSYQDESGTYASNRLLVSESLHMQHTADLGSDFSVDYSQQEFGDTESERLAATAGIAHQLYDSLLSTAEVYGEREEYRELTRDKYGAAGAFNYQKQIPYGRLTANLGGGYSLTKEEGGMSTLGVQDERHRLSGGSTSLLRHSGVVDTSIAVTDSSGTTTYVLDVDYRVTSRGGRVEVGRISSGAIPSGSTVLVDYTYMIDEPFEYNTTDLAAGVQVDLFDHFSAYASRRSSEHDLTSGAEQNRLDDIISTLIGTSVFWGPARLTVEHEDNDSTLSPYTADTVRFDFQQRFARYHNLSLNAIDRRVTFDETGDEDFRLIAATYRLVARDWPVLEITVGSEEENRFAYAEDRMFARLEARYRIRTTEFRITYRHDKRDDDTRTDTDDYFLFSVIRHF